ncbi:DUF2254 family protein [Kitasatospora sp. P5_F3]
MADQPVPSSTDPQASWRLRQPAPGVLFRRPRRALRRGATQLACMVLGLATGLLMPGIGLEPRTESGLVVTLLLTIGFGAVSLVTVIFSLLFLVAQWASTTFTPRLGLFRDEPLIWGTFAYTVGVFVFCVTAGLAIGTRDQVSFVIPVLAVLLAVGSLAAMRALQVKAFNSIQLGPALDAISDRAHRGLDLLYAKPYDGPAAPLPALPGAGRAVDWPKAGAVLQQIDVPHLVAAAAAHGSVVVLTQRPGQQLVRGRPVAHVHGGDLPDDAVLTALLPGVERTFDQDPELAFRLFADIALRALSAAVNDPATAVQALDQLEDALLRLASQDLDVGRVRDADGEVRLIVPVPGWDEYVRTALDDVILAAHASPMTLLRVRRLTGRVLDACPPDRRAVVTARQVWVDTDAAARFPLLWPDRQAAP